MFFNQKKNAVIISFLILVFPKNLSAMHIMEGFLPIQWSIAWSVIALPFIAFGLYVIGKKVKLNPKIKILIGVAGAFAFVLSALKLPSVTGSSSHPTGVGLGSILFGPFVMSVIGCIILLFQALLLAHGGITTLGANTFSMAVAGPFISFGLYKILDGLKSPKWLSVFLAAFFGDLITYVTTSCQLALAFPSGSGGFFESFVKFLSIFAITQIPLAASEGLVTVIIFNVIYKYNKEELKSLSVIKED
jgi:cobalt/nickel transport system permease protein